MQHKDGRPIIWTPQPKQQLALQCPAYELFYGGAAGGGKSDFLLMDHFQQAVKYGKNARGVLFRRSYPELEELIYRAQELFCPTYGKFDNQKNVLKYKNGSYLKFRSLERDVEVTKYQGHQYQWIGFDELGNYPTDYPWRYMKSRNRSAAGVPCFMRGTGNPGGVGHAWNKNRFIDGYTPNKIYKISLGINDGKEEFITRCFIPALLTDNYALMKNDPDYRARMRDLPEHLIRALIYGDWDFSTGQVFEEFRREKDGKEYHVCKPFALNNGEWFKFAAMDWGYSKPYSVGWYAVDIYGHVIKYRELYGCDLKKAESGEYNVGVKETASVLAKKTWEISAPEGVSTMVADPAIWSNSGVDDDAQTIADKFTSLGWTMIKANNDRVNGLAMMHNFLKNEDDYGSPMLRFFSNCYDTIRTLPQLLPAKNNPEDVDTTMEDHSYDETRYAIMSEFVLKPKLHLEKQNGSWNFKSPSRGSNWNPLA